MLILGQTHNTYASDMSCQADNAEIVRKMLVDKDTSQLDFVEQNTLWMACLYGRINIVRMLLDDKNHHLSIDYP